MLSRYLSREHDADDAGPWASVTVLSKRLWRQRYPHAGEAELYLQTAGHVAGRAERLAEKRKAEDEDDELTAKEVVAGVAALHLLRDRIDELEADLLEYARQLGIPWDHLAPAMRVSDRRAAHKRATRLWSRYPRRHNRWKE